MKTSDEDYPLVPLEPDPWLSRPNLDDEGLPWWAWAVMIGGVLLVGVLIFGMVRWDWNL